MKKANNSHDSSLPPDHFPTWGQPRPDLEGKLYVNLMRCSNLSQSDTSPEGQKRINDAFASLCHMKHVADLSAEGVSGSQTFNRQDINDILELHRQKPFDVLLIHDYSRLTRGGIRHGNTVEDRLLKAGIQIVSTTDLIPETPEGDLIKSVKHYSNQLQARGISLAVARGLHQSLQKFSRPAAARTPFALDRLYVAPDGTPRMLIRWLGLVQQWLRPGTFEQVGQRVKQPTERRRDPRTGRIIKRRQRVRFRGYIKQDDESSRLVPGAPELVAVLVWMFTAHYLWRWGYHRIAQDLNQRCVPSPQGSRWALTSVRNILRNPIYLGVEIRHRWSKALYNRLGGEGPVPVVVNQDKLEKEKRESVPQVELPREAWELVDVPQLKDLLPEPLRSTVMKELMELYAEDRVPHPKKGQPRQRHANSPFLLTGALCSKQSGHPMRGELAIKKLVAGPKKMRYYFDGGAAVYGEKGLAIRRLRAEPLEKAVLGVLQQVLADSPRVLASIREEVAKVATGEPDDDRQATLEAERDEIKVRIRAAYKRLGKAGAETVEEEMEADQKRLDRIAQELVTITAHQPANPVDIEGVSKLVAERLGRMRQDFSGLSNAQLKDLIAAMVQGMCVDLLTEELTFTVVLPAGMTMPDSHSAAGDTPASASGTDEESEVRLKNRLPWSLISETNPENGSGMVIPVGHWTCKKPSKNCYACSRIAKAA